MEPNVDRFSWGYVALAVAIASFVILQVAMPEVLNTLLDTVKEKIGF